MNRPLTAVILILVFVCNVFAITVETMDEQVNSKSLTVLRLRINNDTGKDLHNIGVKYYIRKGPQEILVVDEYDLGGARVHLDSINDGIWAVIVDVDSMSPGLFPYEAGICLGIRDTNWVQRNKNQDPSYIASSYFVINDKVEWTLDGDHLPDAEPLTLVSGTKMLVDEGDSIPFAWHRVSNAENYRLTVYSSDSLPVYQKETYGTSVSVALGKGKYLWKVEAKNSEIDYGASGISGLTNYLEIGFFNQTTILEQKIHGIESVSGHKDTPMLVVGWGEFADLREWDRPHLDRLFLDENESESCWAIAIKNLNHFYGGNLSLDEIRWYGKVNGGGSYDSINAFDFLHAASGSEREIMTGLNYALDSTMVYKKESNTLNPLTYEKLKEYLEHNQEIYINMSPPNTSSRHVMLIDAYYTTDAGNFVRCVNTDNRGSYGIYLADTLFKILNWYVIIDPPKKVRNMNPLLGIEKYDKYNTWIEWTDSDGDGITDFDEIYRFGTNPELADSDSDGVNDKNEIYSYTILEKARLNISGVNFPPKVDLRQVNAIGGIEREYMADVDGDSLRAELDPDSDNDGLLDGVDPEPYKPNSLIDTLQINELPKGVVLYARKQLIVNDGTTCASDNSATCIYASEDMESNYGILMGARTIAAELYAKNNVFIRSNPDNVFVVDYYGSDELASARPDGRMTIDRHYDIADWPWKMNINLPEFNEGDSVLVVHHGDTCFLSDDIHLKTLKVESGGVVYFPEGNVYVGNLQLDAGSMVNFLKPIFETNLYVKNRFQWRGNFSIYPRKGVKELARGFRLFYCGFDRIYIDVEWGGTIIAPNAKVILGQTNKKNLYGQFYANEIEVHQYSKLVNVPFDPEQERLEYMAIGKILKMEVGQI